MKTWERKIVPGGFLLAGVLFLVASFKPTMAGQPLNAAFFVLGVALLILGFVLLRKRDIGAAP